MDNTLQTAPLKDGDTVISMNTTHGEILIKLFPEHAPKACANFVGLAKQKYYDGIIFHRIIRDFMIQGGDPTGTGMGGKSIFGEEFEDEFHPDLHHIQGALSMANAGPDTNGSQFFIVHAPATLYLDGMHTVFGQIVEGMNIADDIAHERTGRNDKPLGNVAMISVVAKTMKDGVLVDLD